MAGSATTFLAAELFGGMGDLAAILGLGGTLALVGEVLDDIKVDGVIVGMVTACEIRYTKSGNKPWCNFTLEDYTGSHSFRLFSKDYETFMKYTQVHSALLVKCATKMRFRKKDEQEGEPEYELRIQNITLLSNTKDSFIKEFHVELPLERSTPELRSDLVKEFKRHKGSARLFIDLVFEHDGQEDRLSLFSTKVTLSPDYALYDFLDKHNLRHRLVTKVEL